MTWQEVAIPILVVGIPFIWAISLIEVYHRGWNTGFDEHRQIVDRVRRRRGR